ncbi:MAG: 50S ribosomal protein L11 methyltransferase, partial [Alphaproteobacteria bacterium]
MSHRDAWEITDLLEPYVASVGIFGVDGAGPQRIEAVATTEPNRAQLIEILQQAGFGGLRPHITWLPGIDWLAKNRESFKPIAVGRFFVHDSNHDGPIPANAVALQIDAATAFGTGAHATTQGCLVLLADLLRHRVLSAPVLDLGCGTGILALAIAKARRVPVLATDIDPEAVRITRLNSRRNGLTPWVRAVRADGYNAPEIRRSGPYGLIIANILARPLAQMAPALARNLAPGGKVILSGLLEDQERQVLAPHLAQGLALRRRYSRDGWLALLLENR